MSTKWRSFNKKTQDISHLESGKRLTWTVLRIPPLQTGKSLTIGL